MRTICKEIRNERAVGNIYKQKSNIWKYLLLHFLIYFNTFNDVNAMRISYGINGYASYFSKKCVKNEKRFSPYPAFTYTFNISCQVSCYAYVNFEFRCIFRYSFLSKISIRHWTTFDPSTSFQPCKYLIYLRLRYGSIIIRIGYFLVNDFTRNLFKKKKIHDVYTYRRAIE